MPSEPIECACKCGEYRALDQLIVYHIDRQTKVYVLPEHLQEFYKRERDGAVHRRKMTGADIVVNAKISWAIGPRCAYYWRQRRITLTRDVALGTDHKSICCAWHEIAHSQQPRWLLALASFWYGAIASRNPLWLVLLFPLSPFYFYCEADAWQRVFGDC